MSSFETNEGTECKFGFSSVFGNYDVAQTLQINCKTLNLGSTGIASDYLVGFSLHFDSIIHLKSNML